MPVKVNNRDRWTVTELEKAVLAISRILGEWFREAWDRTNYYMFRDSTKQN